MKTKKCTKCGIEKDLGCFSKNSRAKDGLQRRCKSCVCEYNVEYYQNNKERIAEHRAEYNSRPEVKERKAKYDAKYYSRPEVKERIAEYKAEYRSRPEVKKREAKYDAEYRSRPEVKKRKAKYDAEYKSRPEIKERISEYNAEYRAERKAKQPACVYQIVNTANNKIYIGQTTRGELRWKDHLRDLRGNYHDNPNLQADFNKFGEDAFEWSIIKEYPKDRELLESKEEQLIEQYEKEGKQLYNIHKTENK